MFGPNGKSGEKHSFCRPCRSKSATEWAYANRHSARAERLNRKFKMDAADYFTKLRDQNGVCAICERLCITGKRLAVDHSHETGKIRGLLCTRCNTALGQVKEDPEIILSMLQYLNDHAAIPYQDYAHSEC